MKLKQIDDILLLSTREEEKIQGEKQKMEQEKLQKAEERIGEEIRLAVKDCFVGTTKEAEGGFILDLGRAGAFHIIITRV